MVEEGWAVGAPAHLTRQVRVRAPGCSPLEWPPCTAAVMNPTEPESWRRLAHFVLSLNYERKRLERGPALPAPRLPDVTLPDEEELLEGLVHRPP